MTLREEFDKLLLEIGKEGEMGMLHLVCYEDEARMEDMINFIIKNNLNFNHLWEDSEKGHKAYDDYEKIMIRMLSYEGIDLDMEKERKKIK